MGGEINFVSQLINNNDGGNQQYEYQRNEDKQFLFGLLGNFLWGASIACSAGVQLKAKPNFDTLHPGGALEIRNADEVTE